MDTLTTDLPRAAGGRDPSFGNNGFFVFSKEVYGALAMGRASVAPDGKIVVAATWPDPGVGTAEYYAIARLTPDGQSDPGFGENGMVKGFFVKNKSSNGGYTALTQEQKILLSGYYRPVAGRERLPALARHSNTGELDQSFGNNGIVYFDFKVPAQIDLETQEPDRGGPPDTPADFFSFSVTALSNDKIIFSGVIEAIRDVPTSRFSVLGRLNPDGSLDAGFNQQGYLQLLGIPNSVDSHLVQPDGKIVVCGQVEKGSSTTVYVTRYLEDGTIDPAFGDGGHFYVNDLLNGGHVTAIATHGDGKFILAANKRFATGTPWSGVLIGITADGVWDPAFNNGNPVDIALGTSSFRFILKDILIDGDGVILLGDMGNMAFTRYFLNGSPDTGFGDKPGWWEYSAIETYDLARQADGKFLATGMSIDGSKFVARFLGNA